jgi:DNA-binding GntR family transcriptional regulator
MNLIFQKVVHVTKKNSVSRLLKEAIVSGAIASGDQLAEATMARQFGVGQGLMREALLELEYEGFVQRTPFSNTRVASLSQEDAGQIFDIRIALEPLAFEFSMRMITPKDKAAVLQKVTSHTEKAAITGDLVSFFGNHLTFFRTVWELSESKYLRSTLERLVVPLVVLYLARPSFTCERPIQKAMECSNLQRQILGTYLAGDVLKVKRMVSEYLGQMKAMFISEPNAVGAYEAENEFEKEGWLRGQENIAKQP